MTKGYLGWRGVIKLAKELGYSWQEAGEVLYRKKVNPKTTLDQILICAQIKYDLELVKAGRFLKNKEEIEQLQSFINSFEQPNHVIEKEIVPEVNKVVEEKIVQKVEVKKKEPFIFKTERPRVDYSRYVYWCNPYEPINKGKLGSTQGWRKEKKFPVYY